MKRFPIHSWDEYDDCPRSVPWAAVEPARSTAMKNHGQTLERLAERGGLSPKELVCALDGLKLRSVPALRIEECVRRVRELER